MRNEFAATGGKNSADIVRANLSSNYMVGAFMAVMAWWLDGGAKLPSCCCNNASSAV